MSLHNLLQLQPLDLGCKRVSCFYGRRPVTSKAKVGQSFYTTMRRCVGSLSLGLTPH